MYPTALITHTNPNISTNSKPNSKIYYVVNQRLIWGRFMKKTRGRQSRATVPLSDDISSLQSSLGTNCFLGTFSCLDTSYSFVPYLLLAPKYFWHIFSFDTSSGFGRYSGWYLCCLSIISSVASGGVGIPIEGLPTLTVFLPCIFHRSSSLVPCCSSGISPGLSTSPSLDTWCSAHLSTGISSSPDPEVLHLLALAPLLVLTPDVVHHLWQWCLC